MTTAQITYKASHRVSGLDSPIHGAEHFHAWTITAAIAPRPNHLGGRCPIDLHAVQKLMFEIAPHFGSHGDADALDVAKWWFTQLGARLGVENAPENRKGRLVAIRLLRDDGIGAQV
jgi:hypothetical protein